MVGGSGDGPNLLSCVVLKTIETIETIFFVEKTTFVVEKFQIFCWKALILSFHPLNFIKNRDYRFVSFNHALLTLWKGLFELLIKPIWGAH